MNIIVSIFSLVGVLVVLFLIFAYGFACGYDYYKKQNEEGHELYLGKYILPDIIALSTPNQYSALLQTFEDSEQLLTALVVEYCTTVVINYFDFNTKQFDKVRYFKEVYSKNVDIYGCIMCYIPFIVRSLENNKQYNDKLERKIALSNVIIKFCFSNEYAAKPIDLNILLEALRNVDSPSKHIRLSLEKLIKN